MLLSYFFWFVGGCQPDNAAVDGEFVSPMEMHEVPYETAYTEHMTMASPARALMSAIQ